MKTRTIAITTATVAAAITLAACQYDAVTTLMSSKPTLGTLVGVSPTADHDWLLVADISGSYVSVSPSTGSIHTSSYSSYPYADDIAGVATDNDDAYTDRAWLQYKDCSAEELHLPGLSPTDTLSDSLATVYASNTCRDMDVVGGTLYTLVHGWTSRWENSVMVYARTSTADTFVADVGTCKALAWDDYNDELWLLCGSQLKQLDPVSGAFVDQVSLGTSALEDFAIHGGYAHVSDTSGDIRLVDTSAALPADVIDDIEAAGNALAVEMWYPTPSCSDYEYQVVYTTTGLSGGAVEVVDVISD